MVILFIPGVNDDPVHAEELADWLDDLPCRVNLIPYNTVEGLPWKRPDEPTCRAFRDVLVKSGIPATLRLEKGHDIDAACGQLRLKEERAERKDVT